jgi:hypothetical protein
MAEPSAADAIAIVFAALSGEEQERVLARLNELTGRRGGSETQMVRSLRSLQLVRDYVGHSPTVEEYKLAAVELRDAGHDIEPFTRLYKFFGYSWPRAREALALSGETTATHIEARFQSRKVGQVWKYSEDTLRETLTRCVAHYGRVPVLTEYEYWREQQLQAARAAGTEAHLPSLGPYCRRWGTWEGALLHFGYTPEQVAERLERP